MRLEKRTNYRQLAFEIREERPGFRFKVVPQVMSAFGGGLKEILKELENIFEKDDLCERIVAEMQKKNFDGQWDYHLKSAICAIQSEWINSW